MNLYDLYRGYTSEELSKRMYWLLSRKKTQVLTDIVGIIKDNKNVERLEITQDGVMLHTTEGILYFTFDDMPICRAESILLGTEKEDLHMFKMFIRKGSTVLDIGANVGRVSLALLDNCELNIHAFEPVPQTYEKLKRNIVLNKKEEFIHAHNLGFSNKKGELSFWVSAASEAASMRPLDDDFYVYAGVDGQKEIKCSIDTLDNFMQDESLTEVDFIKVDAEGAEKFIFEGGELFFNTLQPVIYTEMLRKHSARFGYHPNEIINLFEKWGYSCYIYKENKLLPFVEMNNNTLETNFFFLHNVKHTLIVEILAHVILHFMDYSKLMENVLL